MRNNERDLLDTAETRGVARPLRASSPPKARDVHVSRVHVSRRREIHAAADSGTTEASRRRR